jgi:hypothetical protein
MSVRLFVVLAALCSTATPALATWVPRTEQWHREDVVRQLRELYLADQRAAGRSFESAFARLALPDEEVENELPAAQAAEAFRDEEEHDLKQEERKALRAEERRLRLERLASDEIALVDLLATPEAMPFALSPLAFEALAQVGPEREAALLLEVLDAAGLHTPFEICVRLGTLGGEIPGIEDRLIELVIQGPAVLGPTKALGRCAGKATIERLRLAPELARGEMGKALSAYDLLALIAPRDGPSVAQALLEQLEARGELGGCEESRRYLVHMLLGQARDPMADSYLTGWVREHVATTMEDVAPSRELITALQALAELGTDSTIQTLLDLEATTSSPEVQLALVAALGHVPAEAAWELDLLTLLVERLDLAERENAGEPLRRALADSLRRITGAPVSTAAAAWRVYLEQARSKRAAEGEPDGAR